MIPKIKKNTNCLVNNTKYDEVGLNVDIFSIIGKYDDSKFELLEKPTGCDECDSINEILFVINNKNQSKKSEIEKFAKESKTNNNFEEYEVKNIMEGVNRLLI